MPDTAYRDPLKALVTHLHGFDARPSLITIPGGKYDLDQTTKDAAQNAARQTPPAPIRIRIQPAVYFYGGDYKGWRGVAWTLELWTVDQATRLRETIDTAIQTWVWQERSRRG